MLLLPDERASGADCADVATCAAVLSCALMRPNAVRALAFACCVRTHAVRVTIPRGVSSPLHSTCRPTVKPLRPPAVGRTSRRSGRRIDAGNAGGAREAGTVGARSHRPADLGPAGGTHISQRSCHGHFRPAVISDVGRAAAMTRARTWRGDGQLRRQVQSPRCCATLCTVPCLGDWYLPCHYRVAFPNVPLSISRTVVP